jgi:hypothetical protein
MRLEFGTGGKFDEIWALSGYAIFSEMVDKAGSWYTLPDGSRVQGESKVRDYIRHDEDFASQIREAYYSG